MPVAIQISAYVHRCPALCPAPLFWPEYSEEMNDWHSTLWALIMGSLASHTLSYVRDGVASKTTLWGAVCLKTINYPEEDMHV
jgi:hypothetical protein